MLFLSTRRVGTEVDGGKKSRSWEYTADDVIAFLRDHLRHKMPCWKRLKIVESLVAFRRNVQGRSFEDLERIRQTLDQIRDMETELGVVDQSMDDMTDVEGFIDPSEPGVIQDLQRKATLPSPPSEALREWVRMKLPLASATSATGGRSVRSRWWLRLSGACLSDLGIGASSPS